MMMIIMMVLFLFSKNTSALPKFHLQELPHANMQDEWPSRKNMFQHYQSNGINLANFEI